MHVAASNPQFLNASGSFRRSDAKEKEIFLALNADKIAGKPENIVENMVRSHQQVPRRSEPGRAAFREEPGSEGRRPGQQAGAEIVPSFVTKWAKASRRPGSGLRCRSCRSSSRHQAVTKTVSTVARKSCPLMRAASSSNGEAFGAASRVAGLLGGSHATQDAKSSSAIRPAGRPYFIAAGEKVMLSN